MYYAHFGLREPPFKITPNTEFFFSGGNRGAVLDALTYAITSGEGIIKVVGEVGSGKTMLCRMLQTLLPEKIDSVYLANPSVAPEDVLSAIAFELQLGLPQQADRLQVMQALQSCLLERHAAGRQVVVFVEEAQGMPLATLEEIRLLSNLETRHDKLLQIVLFGQPELDANLNATQIRQLRERITHSFKLGPLNRDDIAEYLIFRLRTAGYFGPPIFTKSAIRMISKSSAGLVRRVNILADKALLAAFSDNVYQITGKHVKAAIRDSEFGTEQLQQRRWRRTWLAASAILVLGLALGYALNAWRTGQPAPQLAELQDTPQQASLPDMVDDVAMAAVQSDVEATDEPDLVENSVAVAEIATAAEGGEDLLEQRLQITQQWLHQQPDSTFSIQLMGGFNDEHLRKQLESLSSVIEIDRVYAYRTQVRGLPFVSVLYGSYPDREQASAAMQALPGALRGYRPHLRTIGGVLEETKVVQ